MQAYIHHADCYNPLNVNSKQLAILNILTETTTAVIKTPQPTFLYVYSYS